MRPLILLLLLSALLTACSSQRTEFWPDGTKKSEVSVSSGKYEGPATYYYPSGAKQMTCTYRNDKLEGDLRRFYPDGQVQTEEMYKNGKLDGPLRELDPLGLPIAESHYRNGKLHGRHIEYYPNRRIKIEGDYLEGSHDGIWLYYDTDGSVIGQGTFSRGDGVQKEFYPGGTLRRITRYVKDIKEGEETEYRADGTAETINVYQGGKRVSSIRK